MLRLTRLDSILVDLLGDDPPTVNLVYLGYPEHLYGNLACDMVDR